MKNFTKSLKKSKAFKLFYKLDLRNNLVCKSLANDAPNDNDGERAYTSWKDHLIGMFSRRGDRGQSFLDKVETFLKPFFLQFFLTLSPSDQQNLQNSSFYQTQAEHVHNLFAQYVRQLAASTQGRAELANTNYRVEHHIIPRFDGGTDELQNRVLLHQYEHGLIHLFHYSWKKLSTDLNAFSSACLTEDQLIQRSAVQPTATTLAARKKTTQKAIWQQTSGALGRARRGKSTTTPLLVNSGSVAGQAFQWVNARARTNIFTWFLCTLPLGFKNIQSNQVLWVPPDPNPENHTVSKVAETLLTSPEHIATGGVSVPQSRLSNLSQLFRGERSSMWNWSLDSMKVDDLIFSVQSGKLALLRSFFADSLYLVFNSNSTNFQSFKAQLKTFYCSSSSDNIGSVDMFEKLFQQIQQFATAYSTYLPKVVADQGKAAVFLELYKFCRVTFN